MALLRKSHTLTFYPLTETPDATTKIVTIPTEGTGVEVQGQLTPISSEQAFKATGLELSNAYLFLCDVSPVSSVPIKPNIAATIGTKAFAVRGRPKEWDAVSSLSCAEIYLEQIGFRA